MHLEEYTSLKHHNSFGIAAKARYFIEVTSVSELIEVLKIHGDKTLFVLGGGSNMLLTKDIDALVLHINLKGIEVVTEDEDRITLKVMAGENWHDFVMYCISHNYGGVENLSLIPGNVGTAPIQNIGAYGVELKDVFQSCTAVEVATGEIKIFDKAACAFGYRDSIFKTTLKGNYIITSVTFSLTKRDHLLHTSYGAIKEVLAENNSTDPTIADVSEAVIAIRRSKLPDPKILGNSGSFFKNPIVDSETFKKFRLAFPEAPFYEVSPTQFKIPAGWLIEKAGFKGKRFGDAGVHEHQALVLVNHGDATGHEIWELALKIQREVKQKFGIYIEPEVNVF